MTITIEQMARDVGAVIEFGKAPTFETLVAFAQLVRESYREELLAGVGECEMHSNSDAYTATRRAIVRAAAAIGEAL